jgi:hypothetical protein
MQQYRGFVAFCCNSLHDDPCPIAGSFRVIKKVPTYVYYRLIFHCFGWQPSTEVKSMVMINSFAGYIGYMITIYDPI